MVLCFQLAICLNCYMCQVYDLSDLFQAIHEIELPGDVQYKENPYHIGPYQISYAYWLDSGVPGSWEDCIDYKYSERVMIAYWQRYARDALESKDFQTLARIHHGGPNGHKKQSTAFYWLLVKQNLKHLNRNITIQCKSETSFMKYSNKPCMENPHDRLQKSIR